jgi:tetratricopeptide (TPR) repeat protein
MRAEQQPSSEAAPYLERVAELTRDGRRAPARELLERHVGPAWAATAEPALALRAARLGASLGLNRLGLEVLEAHPELVSRSREARRLRCRLSLRLAFEVPAERAARLRGAERELRSLLWEAPSDHRGHALLGLCLQRQGRAPEAVEAFRCAWALDPHDLDHGFALAVALCGAGRFREAVPYLERVAEARAERPEAHLNLGLALRESGELERALSAFRRAGALAPSLARVHVELGLTYRSLGWADEAIAAFDAALVLEPESVEAHHRRGRLLLRQGRVEEARAALEAARARAPHDPEIRRALQELARLRDLEDEDTLALVSPLPPDLTADLTRFALPDLLEFLGLGRRSGVLEVEADAVHAELELVEGRVLAGQVSGQPSLAERYRAAGGRFPPELERVELGRGAAQLVEALEHAGGCDRAVLDTLSFESGVDTILALIPLESGRARFRSFSADQVNRATRLGVDAQGLLLEAFRRLDEASS